MKTLNEKRDWRGLSYTDMKIYYPICIGFTSQHYFISEHDMSGEVYMRVNSITSAGVKGRYI